MASSMRVARGNIYLWLALVGGVLAVIFLSTASSVPSTTSPKREANFPGAPTAYVTDTANIIDDGIEAQLNRELKEFDTTAQIAVVTIESTQPEAIEEYTIHLAERWGPGYKGRDNGVMLVVASKDRKIRIEVGRGLEGELTDSEAGRIISDIIAPPFKAGDWNKGFIDGIQAIKKEVQ